MPRRPAPGPSCGRPRAGLGERRPIADDHPLAIGITIIAACFAFGGAMIGRLRIARARARVRRRMTVAASELHVLEIGQAARVVGRVRLLPQAAEAPLSGRRCAAWEVALIPGKSPKIAVALHGGRDFEVVDDAGAALRVRWDPRAELLLDGGHDFRYGRSRARGDARASAVVATLEWRSVDRDAASDTGPASDADAPSLAEFQRRFAALLGLAEPFMPPKRGAMLGSERALVDGDPICVLGVVGRDPDGALVLCAGEGCHLAAACPGALVDDRASA